METKIVFANDLLANVERRVKQITIRKGFREFPIGTHLPVFAATGEQQHYDIVPFRVTFCLAKDVPLQNLLDDGFEDRVDMYDSMVTYYPGFGADTPVTVVEFERT